MGTIKQGILGGFSGKVGTVVGCISNGICSMRGLPTGYTDSKTPAQMAQREKFTTVLTFLKSMTAFLRIGFKSQAIKKSAFSAAISYNYKNALTGVYPVFDIDYTKASISQGTLAGALNPLAVSTTEGEVDFTWDNNSTDVGASVADLAMLVLYNPERKQSVSIVAGHTRQSGSQTFTVPDNFQGEEVQCYIAFQNANQSEMSDSQYVGSVIVA